MIAAAKSNRRSPEDLNAKAPQITMTKDNGLTWAINKWLQYIYFPERA
jgi:hypothetical protein